MDKPKEQVIAECTTGCEQHGSIVFYDDKGTVIILKQAIAVVNDGEVIEIPAAGAGNYREVFNALGFQEIEVIDWGSSAGDWSFGVKNEDGWLVASQSNRYPYHGYRYSIDKTHVCETFEQLCEMVANV